ncbi:hypothetical protein ACJJTC_003286 [Scirpophaga incertulas]
MINYNETTRIQFTITTCKQKLIKVMRVELYGVRVRRISDCTQSTQKRTLVAAAQKARNSQTSGKKAGDAFYGRFMLPPSSLRRIFSRKNPEPSLTAFTLNAGKMDSQLKYDGELTKMRLAVLLNISLQTVLTSLHRYKQAEQR